MFLNISSKYFIYFTFIVSYGLAFGLRRSPFFCLSFMIDEFNLTQVSIARLSSLYQVSYLCSKVCSNILSDYFNPKYIYFIAYLLSIIANLLIGYSPKNYSVIEALCVLNAISQGFLWAPLRNLIIKETPSNRNIYFIYRKGHSVLFNIS